TTYRKTPTPNEFWRNVRRRGPHAYRKTPTRIEFRGNLRRGGPATRSPAFSPHGCAPGAKPWGRASHGGSSGARGAGAPGVLGEVAAPCDITDLHRRLLRMVAGRPRRPPGIGAPDGSTW